VGDYIQGGFYFAKGLEMENGFIKIHRSILNWEWYDDPNTMRVFIHLLLNAQWEDSRYHGYEVPKGSLVIGRKELSEELGITERAVRTALNHLKTTNEVTIKTTNKFSVVTIVNWEKYQCSDSEVTNKTTNKRPTSDQQVTNERPTTDHIKEYKEIKNIRIEEEKKEESILDLYNSVCYLLKPCSILTKTRLEKVKSLLEKFTPDEIKSVFEKANKSDFILGKNDRGWKATFDWLIDIDNFVKVKDGNFDNVSNVYKGECNNYKKHYYDFDALEREARGLKDG